jgi:hypothetical protein
MRIIRIIRDLICILIILIMPLWLMELLKIDVSLQKIIEEMGGFEK